MKKTLFIDDGYESEKVLSFFSSRFDVNIIKMSQNLELCKKIEVTIAPTLVIEEWEYVINIVGVEKIEEYLSDEPTPNYPCVCEG
ncbi:MAG: hypothetical protein ACRCZR_09560 [Cetobacterium sp.]